MWQVTAAQRVIEDVYDRMVSSGSYGRPTRVQAPPAAVAAAAAVLGRAAGSDAGKAGGSGSHHHTNGGARHAGAGAAAGAGGHAGGSGNTLADAMTAYIRNQMASQTHAGAAQTRAVRCPCGSASERGVMLQCRAAGCGVWQHANCVGVAGDTQPAGGPFHCELCRAKRADPFWEVLEAVEIMAPARLNSNNKQMMVREGRGAGSAGSRAGIGGTRLGALPRWARCPCRVGPGWGWRLGLRGAEPRRGKVGVVVMWG